MSYILGLLKLKTEKFQQEEDSKHIYAIMIKRVSQIVLVAWGWGLMVIYQSL
jgi:hypothetical protein